MDIPTRDDEGDASRDAQASAEQTLQSRMSKSGAEALRWARELHGEGGAGIATLQGYLADIARTRDACERILREFQSTTPDEALIELLWTAAVVTYMRPFQRDARQDLPDDFVDHLSAEGLAAHRDFVAVRNKHVAHSENSMETVIAVCFLGNPEVEERGVTGIGTVAMRRSFGPQDVLRLLHLAGETNALLERLTRRFVAHIRAQVDARPLDDLYAEQPVSQQWVQAGASPADKRPKVRRDSAPILLG